ncbi:MAG: efflux RND transporter periplasmic adaptor subunit [Rubrivivax sp.]|nr:efflux RND transporter periplasmic adaptor subunit [Rubrivivax sp.]
MDPRPAAHPMDSPLPPRRLPRAAGWAAAVVLLLLALGALAAWRGDAGLELNSPSLPLERVTVSEVRAGVFDDLLALRATVAPRETIYLDAVEGGRVERKLVEDGAELAAGQPVAVLSNSALQLELIRSEAEVTQQLNTLRALELQIERQRADNARLLAEGQWQLQRASAKLAREQQLLAQGFVSRAALLDSDEEQRFLQQRQAINEAAQRTDEALQRSQIEQLRAATQQLQASLALARANREALTVRAPVAGQLTAFELTVGQSLQRGQRIGQIDSGAQHKLVVLIDEHFLPRVAVGQSARLELAGQPWPLKVRRLNPQVKGGQFEAELVFDGAQPPGLKRGQNLSLQLALGESRQALLLPAGPFLADAAGASVFVLQGSRAQRRAVKLGQRNVQVVEVLAGLQAGEQVITSSHPQLAGQDRVIITR